MSHTKNFALSVIKRVLFGEEQAGLHEDDVRKIEQYITSQILKLFNDLLKAALPFSLYIQNSTIPSSGKGVFVKGKIERGNLVCFYKGRFKPT
jgi:hypothetical protein